MAKGQIGQFLPTEMQDWQLAGFRYNKEKTPKANQGLFRELEFKVFARTVKNELKWFFGYSVVSVMLDMSKLVDWSIQPKRETPLFLIVVLRILAQLNWFFQIAAHWIPWLHITMKFKGTFCEIMIYLMWALSIQAVFSCFSMSPVT